MASSENISMAVFCDFENVALGVRDANYEKFDIKPVLERLLLKGSIVVKKAYCDWERYKGFKSTMHEANFELIEIPHVRQSGKNSADIRLVVDALDLCYTKSHVNTFVIISGDSDFSPLVSKLRENNKQVIGVGVKQSTSDLLVANCDEFIFYDDLVREVTRAAAKRKEVQEARKSAPQNKRPGDDRRKEELEARKTQALEMVVETFDALVSERGDTGKIWASLLKDTLKRRRPEFSEVYYGFRTFGNLLEEAQVRGLFEFGRDEKSGTYVYRSSGVNAAAPAEGASAAEAILDGAQTSVIADTDEAPAAAEPKEEGKGKGRTRGGRGRKNTRGDTPFVAVTPDEAAEAVEVTLPAEQAADEAGDRWPMPAALEEVVAAVEPAVLEAAPAPAEAAEVPEAAAPAKKERRRAPRKPAAKKGAPEAAATEAAPLALAPGLPQAEAEAAPAEPAPAEVPVAEVAAPVAALAQDDENEYVLPDDVNGNVAAGERGNARAKGGRGASNRPAAGPARKPAARSRRPAKPKAGQ
ncbi:MULTISPECIES: NYN domain-containing protein [unclassified Massilia]|uniref:NYN domain-containing protein n=1 Tax=unclassified Massilia TaxID=2609279 RepID=UPI00177CB5F8|nr:MULTISPECIES: NYN domain-containing protein [unclassified Massilia]MBD8532458.1 NYN domain-containing protein [Massilia sp. CFBP 13647]MBD8675828.1 NYN domain-containing protein [Massilia sp. CFBP 13721]